MNRPERRQVKPLHASQHGRAHQWPCSRRLFSCSMASAAESFRFIWGSDRGAPECSKQRAPAATPHVGHGTDINCFCVKSPILIPAECDEYTSKNCFV